MVSTERILANQDLDALIDRGVFQEIQIPEGALVEAAVTDIRQLEGTTTTTVILKNGQISTTRLTTEPSGPL